MQRTIPALALLAVILAGVMAGCAAYRPVVDYRSSAPGRTPETYEADLGECRELADQAHEGQKMARSGAVGGLTGGAIGAGLGAIGGAIAGDAGQGAALGAALGGATGATSGVAGAAGSKDQIIRRCMAGRGYYVLD